MVVYDEKSWDFFITAFVTNRDKSMKKSGGRCFVKNCLLHGLSECADPPPGTHDAPFSE